MYCTWELVTIDLMMGQCDSSMGATFRQRIEHDTLKAVTDTVRRWLWPVG